MNPREGQIYLEGGLRVRGYYSWWGFSGELTCINTIKNVDWINLSSQLSLIPAVCLLGDLSGWWNGGWTQISPGEVLILYIPSLSLFFSFSNQLPARYLHIWGSGEICLMFKLQCFCPGSDDKSNLMKIRRDSNSCKLGACQPFYFSSPFFYSILGRHLSVFSWSQVLMILDF